MIADYILHKKVSNALYGSIWLAVNTKNLNKYAIKRMNMNAMNRKCTLNDQVSIEEDGFVERKVNRLVSSALPANDTIVKMITDFEENGHMYFVFEYCPYGDLLNVIQQKGRLDPSQALRYFRNIVSGVRDLQQIGYAHRDLSLENVLLDKDDRAKLCDLGLATEAKSIVTGAVGKKMYMAPELHSRKCYSPILADSWSLGVMLAIMLTGIPPFEEAAISDARFRLVKKKGIRALFRRWNIEKSIASSALDLLSKLLAVKPRHRLDIDGILKHPWVCGDDSNRNSNLRQSSTDTLEVNRGMASKHVNIYPSLHPKCFLQSYHEKKGKKNLISIFKQSLSDLRNKMRRHGISSVA